MPKRRVSDLFGGEWWRMLSLKKMNWPGRSSMWTASPASKAAGSTPLAKTSASGVGDVGVEPLMAAGQNLHATVGAGGVVDRDPGGEDDVGRGLEVGAVLVPGDCGVPASLLAARPFDLEISPPEHEMGAENAGRALDEVGMAEQIVDAAVVEMAVVEVVAFG